MLGDESTKPREAEHISFGAVRLYQAVAVEEGCLACLQEGLLLLIAHPGHEAQRHPSGPELLAVATTPHIGQVMACVGVSQGTALGLQDGVEARYEHVGGDARKQRL